MMLQVLLARALRTSKERLTNNGIFSKPCWRYIIMANRCCVVAVAIGG